MRNKVAEMILGVVVLAVLVGGLVTLQLILSSSAAENARLSQDLVISDAYVASVQDKLASEKEKNVVLGQELGIKDSTAASLQSQITSLQQEKKQESTAADSLEARKAKEESIYFYYAVLLTNMATAFAEFVPAGRTVTIDHGASPAVVVSLEVQPDRTVLITVPGSFSPDRLPVGISQQVGIWPAATVRVEKLTPQ